MNPYREPAHVPPWGCEWSERNRRTSTRWQSLLAAALGVVCHFVFGPLLPGCVPPPPPQYPAPAPVDLDTGSLIPEADCDLPEAEREACPTPKRAGERVLWPAVCYPSAYSAAWSGELARLYDPERGLLYRTQDTERARWAISLQAANYSAQVEYARRRKAARRWLYAAGGALVGGFAAGIVLGAGGGR